MRDASTLCRACALCCDGTLFDRVPLLPADEVPLPVVERPAALAGAPPARHLAQACAGLRGHECGCYAQRPTACRQFVCLLATAYGADEVSLPEALEVVAQARQLPEPGRAGFLRFHFGRR